MCAGCLGLCYDCSGGENVLLNPLCYLSCRVVVIYGDLSDLKVSVELLRSQFFLINSSHLSRAPLFSSLLQPKVTLWDDFEVKSSSQV